MGIDKYKVTSGNKFLLKNYETTPGKNPMYDKKERADILKKNKDEIRVLQSRLYADGKAGVLIVLQGMDGGGKDSVIRNVIGVNPQGVKVHNFRQPSTRELNHDYLWRVIPVLPQRGMISIFNRSYYEDVLVVKVHELYRKLNILDRCKDDGTIKRRYKQIKNFEEYLWENGVITVKLFLHLSKEEQCKRFLRRIDREDKNWKFSDSDLKERGYWDNYQEAYETAIAATSTPENPWWILPADKKEYTHVVASEVILETLKALNPQYPVVTKEQRQTLIKNREILTGKNA
ncbi:MAG: polyphosphate kinase 2 family protein [Treponema sp.]|nr:polyphosphate kinase 2 family protein [Treponema sp.]